jgi:hypothetical protein
MSYKPYKPSQDLFFKIWSNLLDQIKDNSRPEQLEKLLNFSCFEKDFLQVSLNKIDDLIRDGIDINLPFYIHPPHGYMYTKENALRQTIQIYNFGYFEYTNKYVYNDKDSKSYLEELIYYLIERCQIDKNIIIFIIGHKKLYKILEDLLKRFEGKIDFSDYKISTTYIGYMEYGYLEILLGFSCLDLDKKIFYSYRKTPILPIESILIEYIFNYTLNYTLSCDYSKTEVGHPRKERDEERKTLIKNNIFLLKKYSPEPSYDQILTIVKKDFKIFSNVSNVSKDSPIKINDEDITNLVIGVFRYFDYVE